MEAMLLLLVTVSNLNTAIIPWSAISLLPNQMSNALMIILEYCVVVAVLGLASSWAQPSAGNALINIWHFRYFLL